MSDHGASAQARWWVWRPLAFAAASGALIHAGLFAHHLGTRGTGADTPRTLPGAALSAGRSAGAVQRGALRLSGIPTGHRVSATTGGLELRAEEYDHVEVTLEGGHPEMLAVLLWSTAAAPEAVQRVGLWWSATGDRLVVRVRGLEGWSGTVTGLGVGFVGPSPGAIIVDRITLWPADPWLDLRFAWRKWLAPEGLRAYSPNFILGGPPNAPLDLPAVPIAAVWVGLALALYAAELALRRGVPDPRVVLGIGLAGWLALDARWQLDLFRQLARTLHAESPMSLPAPDADLRLLATRVHARLPLEPQRLFVLTRDHRDLGRYTQLRMGFLLLPHNVSVHHSVPPPGVRSGGYLLLMGPRTDIRYEPVRGVLLWSVGGEAPGTRVPVELQVEPVLRDRVGTLYRIP